MTHPGPMPLAANLRDPWDYTTKCTGPRSLEHSFSGSSSQHTALAHSPNGPSCPPTELHRGKPVILDRVLEAGTAGTAVLHRSSMCGTQGSQSQAQARSTYKVWDTFMTHHCCWGQKCAVCPGHRTDTFMSSRNRDETVKLI